MMGCTQKPGIQPLNFLHPFPMSSNAISFPKTQRWSSLTSNNLRGLPLVLSSHSRHKVHMWPQPTCKTQLLFYVVHYLELDCLLAALYCLPSNLELFHLLCGPPLTPFTFHWLKTSPLAPLLVAWGHPLLWRTIQSGGWALYSHRHHGQSNKSCAKWKKPRQLGKVIDKRKKRISVNVKESELQSSLDLPEIQSSSYSFPARYLLLTSTKELLQRLCSTHSEGHEGVFQAPFW